MTDQTIGSLDSIAAVSQPAHTPAQPRPGTGAQAQRPARVPLGWLSPEQGELLLANHTATGVAEARHTRVSQARNAVAARAGWTPQAGLVSPLPAELADHVARLEATPASAGMRAEGWDIAMVDLEQVVGFQPHVFTDTVTGRVASLDPGDLRSIAELTLPINHQAPVSVQYDELRQAYVITSPNPNVKVVGNFNGPMPDGTPCFGFRVTVTPSFVQVVRYRDRYILRDGYHRAFGLLSRGITRVPAYVRDFDTTENLAPAGMLPQSVWLGDRPPLLRDYHDGHVAETVSLFAQHRVILVHAIETFALN
jgi:hypothetical protein